MTTIASRSTAFTDSHITLHHQASYDNLNTAAGTYRITQSIYATTDNGTGTWSGSSESWSGHATGSSGASGGPSDSGSRALNFSSNGGATIYFVHDSTGTYTCDDDGTGSISMAASAGTWPTIGSASLSSKSYTMPTIPRKLSLATITDTPLLGTASLATTGTVVSGFTYRLSWAIGTTTKGRNAYLANTGSSTGGTDGTNGYMVINPSNAVSFTPPIAFAKYMVNNTPTVVTFTLQTLNGSGTVIGTDTSTLNVLTSTGGAVPYRAPTISGFTARRATGVSPYTGADTSVYIAYSAQAYSVKVTAGTEQNYLLASLDYSIHGANSWTNIAGGSKTSTTGLTYNRTSMAFSTFAEANNYDFRVTLTDAAGTSVSFITTVGAVSASLDVYDPEDGTHAAGIGIGTQYSPTLGGPLQVVGATGVAVAPLLLVGTLIYLPGVVSASGPFGNTPASYGAPDATHFAVPAWCRAIEVEMSGGGGAGGGAASTGSSTSSKGAGGTGGTYSKVMILASDLSASEQVTAAAAVNGGNGDGPDGNASSFGLVAETAVYTTAPGGPGGSGASSSDASGSPSINSDTSTGANGVVPPGGITIRGEVGRGGAAFTNTRTAGGKGGNSIMGSGGRVAVNGSTGGAGVGYGGGGAGANNTTSTSAQAGGNGSSGIVIIRVFA